MRRLTVLLALLLALVTLPAVASADDGSGCLRPDPGHERVIDR